MQTRLPSKTIVLLGVGHTNAHVLRMWRMKPRPDTDLVCLSDFGVATYSGMLPGVLAGQYPRERMQIDLVRLCAAARARLVLEPVVGLDVPERRVLFEDRPPLEFDALSIGIGSQPVRQNVDGDSPRLLPIKPMQTFLDRFDAKVEGRRAQSERLRIVVVGGGVGGAEIALCLPGRLKGVHGLSDFQVTVVTADDQVPGGVLPATAARVQEEMARRGYEVLSKRRVVRLDDGTLILDNGDRLEADLILWATSATASPLLARFDLPADDRGFLLTRPTLQTVADAPIFAVGDSGTLADDPTPKAGVYAVRQGPVLWENLHRMLDDRPLQTFRPQSGFLKLINTGDGRAVVEYKGLTHIGRAWWKLKDWIDGRFMDKYQDYRPMEMKDAPSGPAPAMRCLGCGGKVGGSILSNVLAGLEVPQSERVLVGLHQPDDAAILQTNGQPLSVTTDFFAAPFDDPFLVGRIAALNAVSDAFAVGSRPHAALAVATLPEGRGSRQQQLLHELLAGSLCEFAKAGVSLVGGHTIEGPRVTFGFTVLGDQSRDPLTKGALQLDQLLLLTKPLGTGVLLAAHMQAKCTASWWRPLLEAMLASNQEPARLAWEAQVTAMTDVTGFGLAGHLLEMLRASNVSAALNLDALPLLPGTAQCLAEGIESTLAPDNRGAETALDVSEENRSRPEYRALFDPQTSGGLLMGVSEEQSAALQQSLEFARVIGRVTPADSRGPRIVVE